MPRRAILVVLDSVGAGALPDAAAYGDTGSDTLGNIARQVPLTIPVLAALGLGATAVMPGVAAAAVPRAAWGRMAERSAGKDSVTGHWELMGVVLEEPFPTFPHGFPTDLIAAFEARIGRHVLGNCVASGTAVIDALGDEHVATGRPIVYTSADSVFQIAAHEGVAGGRGARARPCHRATLRGHVRGLDADGQPPRLRHAAHGRDAARSADGARRAGDGGGEGERPLRRTRHQPGAADGQ
jgi:phosphopentomutase